MMPLRIARSVVLLAGILGRGGSLWAQDAPPPLEGPSQPAGEAPPQIGPLEDDGRPSPDPGPAPRHEAEVVAEGRTAAVVRAPVSPPRPREDPAPTSKPPIAGARWLAGYWEWQDDRASFVWVEGTWKVPQAGRNWIEGRWTRDENGWYRTSGRWSPEAGDRRVANERPNPTNDRAPSPPEAPPTAPSPFSTGGWNHDLDELRPLPEAAPPSGPVEPTSRRVVVPPANPNPSSRPSFADRPASPMPEQPSGVARERTPRDGETPASSSPVVGAANRLADQSGRFYQAVAAIAGRLPDGRERLLEAHNLQLSARELSEAATQGADPARLLAVAQKADGWRRHIARGLQGRGGLDEALAIQMAASCEQILSILRDPLPAGAAGLPALADTPIPVPVAIPSNPVPPWPAPAQGNPRQRAPRRGPLPRIGRMLRPR